MRSQARGNRCRPRRGAGAEPLRLLFPVLLAPLFGCTPHDPMFPNASTPQGQCEIQVDNDPRVKQLETERFNVESNRFAVAEVMQQENALRQQLYTACMQGKAQ